MIELTWIRRAKIQQAVLLLMLFGSPLGCASQLHPRLDSVATEIEPTILDAEVRESETKPWRPTESSDGFGQWEWPGDDRFQSAGRLRELSASQTAGLPPNEEIERLREHFMVVIEWLEDHEQESLDQAVARLEFQSESPWTAARREAAYRDLQSSRRKQIANLTDYAARGRFPIHPEPEQTQRPIFVDAKETACAVGHLMVVDGWADSVRRIARTRNGVYVEDVREGPLLAWVRSSGLLVEEAALIQPSYMPPPGNVDLEALAQDDGFVERGGIRIENLSAIEHVVAEGGSGTESSTLSPDQFSDINLTISNHYVSDNGGVITSSGPNAWWTFWDAGDDGGFFDLSVDPPFAGARFRFDLAFDVSSTQAGYGIGSSLFEINGHFWTNALTYGSQSIQMEIRDNTNALLASVILGDDSDEYRTVLGEPRLFLSGRERSTFAPQQALSVNITGFAADIGSAWRHFHHEFELVPIPEPNVALSIGIGLAVLASARGARYREGAERSP